MIMKKTILLMVLCFTLTITAYSQFSNEFSNANKVVTGIGVSLKESASIDKTILSNHNIYFMVGYKIDKLLTIGAALNYKVNDINDQGTTIRSEEFYYGVVGEWDVLNKNGLGFFTDINFGLNRISQSTEIINTINVRMTGGILYQPTSYYSLGISLFNMESIAGSPLDSQSFKFGLAPLQIRLRFYI